MADDGEPAEGCSGSALGGAVEVLVDRRGQVVSVRLDPAVLRRLSPEQLGRGVVTAHAEARAGTRMAGEES